MKLGRDNSRIHENNPFIELAMMSVLGDRKEQQDSYGYRLGDSESIIVLGDGMGGYEGGERASDTVVNTILEEFTEKDENVAPPEFIRNALIKANERVCEISDDRGERIKCGSTAVVILIKGNELFWGSVGDSRAYLYRNGEFAQFTLDHNYLTVLREQRNAGVISEEEFMTKSQDAEALISYVGIGDLKLIDYNDKAFTLEKDDVIVIMSDGLYKLVSDDDMMGIIENFKNIEEALTAMDGKAGNASLITEKPRDNTTIGIIRINQEATDESSKM